MLLVMGSCRVAEPFIDWPDVRLYPGGHVHSTAEFLQAIRIMRGDIAPPQWLDPYLFRGWGNIPDRRLDLSDADAVIMELCSLKSYRFGPWLLHVGYEDNVTSGELDVLPGAVVLHRESADEVVSNLGEIARMFGDVPLVIVLHSNLPCLPERYLLASVASQWCRANRHALIDATALVALNGAAACLPKRDGPPLHRLHEGSNA